MFSLRLADVGFLAVLTAYLSGGFPDVSEVLGANSVLVLPSLLFLRHSLSDHLEEIYGRQRVYPSTYYARQCLLAGAFACGLVWPEAALASAMLLLGILYNIAKSRPSRLHPALSPRNQRAREPRRSRPEPPVEAPPPAPARSYARVLGGASPDSPPATGACPYCGDGLAAAAACRCEFCDTPHHQDCWLENEGCTTFACEGTQAIRT